MRKTSKMLYPNARPELQIRPVGEYRHVLVRRLCVVGETDRALLVQVDDGSSLPAWLPRSAVAKGMRYRPGDSGDIVMSAWIAKEKGFTFEELPSVAMLGTVNTHVLQEPHDLDEQLKKLQEQNVKLQRELEETKRAFDEAATPSVACLSRTQKFGGASIEGGPGIAKLPMRPARDTSVWVADVDCLCDEEP